MGMANKFMLIKQLISEIGKTEKNMEKESKLMPKDRKFKDIGVKAHIKELNH
jgi:hypothetical protein